MRLKPTGSVHALLCADQWSDASLHAVRTSLRGQVEHMVVHDQRGHQETDAVLVVTTPVVFARGAVKRLQQRAAHPDRIVTRVLVPGQDLAGVALWSTAWLRREGIGPEELPACGLEFDRDRLPHEAPQARSWIRADEVGLAVPDAGGADLRRWIWTEGVRLTVRRAVGALRAVLGRLRRTRALARQRRRQSGSSAHVR